MMLAYAKWSVAICENLRVDKARRIKSKRLGKGCRILVRLPDRDAHYRSPRNEIAFEDDVLQRAWLCIRSARDARSPLRPPCKAPCAPCRLRSRKSDRAAPA